MFRFPLFIAITLIVAFGGGIMISLYALDATQGFGAIKLGAWEAFPALQTVEADPYAKSHRARAGKLRQIGLGGNLVDAVYIDNAADPHLLATFRLTPGTVVARACYVIPLV